MAHHFLVTSLEIYLKTLDTVFIPHVSNGFKSLYKQALEKLVVTEKDNNPNGETTIDVKKRLTTMDILINYRTYLKQIHKFPLNVFMEDLQTLSSEKKDEMHNIINNIFQRYAKINLVSHGLSHRINIDHSKLEIPTLETFVKQIYVECAKIFSDELYLFDYSSKNTLKIQKNNHKINKRIGSAIRRVLNYYVIKNDIKVIDMYVKKNKEFEEHMTMSETSVSYSSMKLNPENVEKVNSEIRKSAIGAKFQPNIAISSKK
jgi:hypothetical protein